MKNVFVVFALGALTLLSLVDESVNLPLDDKPAETSTTSNGRTTENGGEICVGRTPCGWAVYKRPQRTLDYYMANKCSCNDGLTCLRDEDDLSLSAYVYRCLKDNPEHPGKRFEDL